jgi:hypothetical protein
VFYLSRGGREEALIVHIWLKAAELFIHLCVPSATFIIDNNNQHLAGFHDGAGAVLSIHVWYLTRASQLPCKTGIIICILLVTVSGKDSDLPQSP